MNRKTYWNGERATCRQVRVRVREWQEGDPPLAWWRDLAGSVRQAVEVIYGGRTFYLDDDDLPEELLRAHYNNQEATRAAFEERGIPFEPQEPGSAGHGWAKVTKGKGSPGWGHRDLAVAQVLQPFQCEDCLGKAEGSAIDGARLCYGCASKRADRIEVLVHQRYPERREPYQDAWHAIWGGGRWPNGVPPAMIADEPEMPHRVYLGLARDSAGEGLVARGGALDANIRMSPTWQRTREEWDTPIGPRRVP